LDGFRVFRGLASKVVTRKLTRKIAILEGDNLRRNRATFHKSASVFHGDTASTRRRKSSADRRRAQRTLEGCTPLPCARCGRRGSASRQRLPNFSHVRGVVRENQVPVFGFDVHVHLDAESVFLSQ
jgi:hypothetical protein